MLINKQKKEVKEKVNIYTRNSTKIHWLWIIVCAFLYIALISIIVKLSLAGDEVFLKIGGNIIYNSTIQGLIAQGLVLLAILIVLNPIKKSYLLAIMLNVILAAGAAHATLLDGELDALPGLFVPTITCVIIIIIHRYASSLNNQITKVLRYNKILIKNDEMLNQIAYYDPLTDLPNRKMMIDRMRLLTDPTFPEMKDFVFVLFDLDNFKKINSTVGHSIGDLLLKNVADRWRQCVYSSDLFGRIGGDEFAIIISRRISREDLTLYLESFHTALSEPIEIDHKEFTISVSSGVVIYPEDGCDTTELLKNADIALYKAKSAGKNETLFFNKEMQEEIVKRIRLENGLQSAIKNKELYMVFQPQYVCGTNKLRGYEALARWRFQEMEFISPTQFIRVAEETGSIIEIGKWIIQSVLHIFVDYQKRFHQKPIVSINISVVQMTESSFVSMIKEILEETGFDARYLELEITESVFITYPDHIIDVIKQLRQLGIRIALDDFGTGYASLSYLQLLPINILKIDKTFIDKIKSKDAMNQIVGSIIAMSHQLNIEVIAEGVEREEQLQYLIDNHCDYIQGFLLSEPIELEELIDTVQDN